MAKVNNGFPAKRHRIAINGSSHPTPMGMVTMTTKVDGQARSWTVKEGSHHLAGYAAAISAMKSAHAAGVTHLELQTPANLMRRQATGTFACKDADLALMLAICEMYAADFDDVDWLQGPA